MIENFILLLWVRSWI